MSWSAILMICSAEWGEASGLLDKYCNELKTMHPFVALKSRLKSHLRTYWHVSNLLQNLANKPLAFVLAHGINRLRQVVLDFV